MADPTGGLYIQRDDGRIDGPHPLADISVQRKHGRLGPSAGASPGGAIPFRPIAEVLADLKAGMPLLPERWYLRLCEGADTMGPLTAAELRAGLASGEHDLEMEVSADGERHWVELGALSDFTGKIATPCVEEAEPAASGQLLHFAGHDGQVYGPYAETALRAWLTEGRITLTDRVSRGGDQPWVPIVECDRVSRHLTGDAVRSGVDPQLAFSEPSAIRYLDAAQTAAADQRWGEAARNLTHFARLKRHRFTLWQMMRDEDRLWSIVRELARRPEGRPALAEMDLVCAECGRQLVSLPELPAGHPALVRRYFPCRAWRCWDPEHLRTPEPTTMTFPDLSGRRAPRVQHGSHFLQYDRRDLEYPIAGGDADLLIGVAKMEAQRAHRVLEDLEAGLLIAPDDTVGSIAYYNYHKHMAEYAAAEQRARRR